MQAKTIQYYDWYEDIQPVLYDNLCASLRAQGIDCPDNFRGGWFKDGHWVDVDASADYRDYWHVYLKFWGERIRNDSYVMTYFPPNDPKEWDGWRAEAKTEFGPWAVDLVDAVHKMLVDHKIYNDDDLDAAILIWFSW